MCGDWRLEGIRGLGEECVGEGSEVEIQKKIVYEGGCNILGYRNFAGVPAFCKSRIFLVRRIMFYYCVLGLLLGV